MNRLYKVCGISKQSFHQYHNRLLTKLQEEAYLRTMIEKIRRDHPTMGCRDMYFKIRPKTMDRDAFEDFCREEGYMIKYPKSFRRTTKVGMPVIPQSTTNFSSPGTDTGIGK